MYNEPQISNFHFNYETLTRYLKVIRRLQKSLNVERQTVLMIALNDTVHKKTYKKLTFPFYSKILDKAKKPQKKILDNMKNCFLKMKKCYRISKLPQTAE